MVAALGLMPPTSVDALGNSHQSMLAADMEGFHSVYLPSHEDIINHQRHLTTWFYTRDGFNKSLRLSHMTEAL